MRTSFLSDWRDRLRATLDTYDRHEDIVTRETRPIPAPEMIRLVNSPDKAEPSAFLRSGAGDLLAIVGTLADAVDRETREIRERRETSQAPAGGGPAAEPPVVMELGCGLGRLLRHAPPPSQVRTIATDVNAERIAWCQAHLPEIEYHHHDSLPPIASLPDESVDVIYAHSVFTHIPLESQQLWLQELARVLRPGGWLAATFIADTQLRRLLHADQRATFAAEGAIQIHPEWTPGRDEPVAFGVVCQSIAQQEAALAPRFDLHARHAREDRQDVVVARRR